MLFFFFLARSSFSLLTSIYKGGAKVCSWILAGPCGHSKTILVVVALYRWIAFFRGSDYIWVYVGTIYDVWDM